MDAPVTNILTYLFQSAERRPDKTAVACGEETYTFSRLKSASLRAAALIDPRYENRSVAVFAGRNAHVAVSYLAAVCSGNFYVPIDPDMPTEKIQAILDDSGAEYLFGDEETRPLLDRLHFSGTFLTPDDASEREAAVPELSPDAPLYMVYTSGSTGKPKGVLKSHGAVISFIEAYCSRFDFSSDDVIGNQTPFFFDASAKDFYLMLKTGASLEIIPTQYFAMPTDLVEYLNEKKITFISWVPTALSMVSQLKIFSYAVPQTLKKVFFVGEVMPMKHLNYWRKYLPGVQFVNLYGQSELAGICCYYEVTGEYEDTAVLPMGRPLENCRLYLVDGDQVITEPGVKGEMYIVSDALALEYYHDPEKTAACFLTRDFGEGPVRCFKTGDLASFDENGSYTFASRTDFQIKHMGHRIELGEIEAVAGALPEIGRCCCLYHSEKRKIVLFCEPAENAEITGREIQSVLRTKLSSYMVPGKVEVLDRLPLNANGKIDRQKLKERL